MKMMKSLAALAAVAMCQPAYAADLGGSCCTDLEERVAELEATTARKGNRKVSLVVFGEVNKAIVHGFGSGSDTFVLDDNTTSETYVGVRGEARFSPDLKAGYAVEFRQGVDGGSGLENLGEDISTRQSYAYISSARIGTFSIGLQSTATDDIYQSVAHTDAVVKPLTAQPFIGVEPLNGGKADVIKYVSPSVMGFTVSAAWGEDDVADVAVRYADEVQGFKFYGAAGYSRNTDDNSLINALVGDHEVVSVAASVMHLQTGLFASAYWAQIDSDAFDKIDAYHLMGGVERKFIELGATTIFGEYANASDIDLKFYGAGVVQQLGSEDVEAYLSLRSYDGGSFIDGDVATAGMRIKF